MDSASIITAEKNSKISYILSIIGIVFSLIIIVLSILLFIYITPIYNIPTEQITKNISLTILIFAGFGLIGGVLYFISSIIECFFNYPLIKIQLINDGNVISDKSINAPIIIPINQNNKKENKQEYKQENKQKYKQENIQEYKQENNISINEV